MVNSGEISPPRRSLPAPWQNQRKTFAKALKTRFGSVRVATALISFNLSARNTASCLSLRLQNALRSTLGMGLGALPPPIFKLFFLFLRAWMELSSALLVAFEACSPIVTLGSYLSGDPPGNSSWTFPSLTQTGESYCLNLLVLCGAWLPDAWGPSGLHFGGSG